MKAVNVSPAMPAADVAKAPSSTTSAVGATDFLALFTQAMTSGAEATDAPANFLNAGFNLGTGKDEGKFDADDLAALMATLAGANAIPMQPSTDVSGLPQAGIGARDLQTANLASAIMTTLAGAAAEADATKGTNGRFDVAMSAAEAGAADPSLDPRFGQSALDAVRNVSAGSQSEAVVHRQLHATVGTKAWADELGTQMSLMTERGQHTASLRLSPEHLGPLEIQISIEDDRASVWFGAAHADTRAAIEGALPRLREMFAAQGLALNDAGVFQESPRQQAQFRPERPVHVDGSPMADDPQSVPVARLGLVDAYA